MRDEAAGASPEGLTCPSCGTEIAPRLLTCPGCQRLIHADRLKQLAEEAEHAQREGHPGEALALWREALELLPPRSRQHQVIAARVEELSRQADASPAATARAGEDATAETRKAWAGGGAAGLGALGLFLWKMKFLAVLALTKAKFLLLGLTKASTFLSMFLSMGVYWAAFGWKFALGLVLSIYVHEMGHVASLLRYGVKASPPLFVPGLGAMVRLRQSFTSPREDARVGLAGPLWGLGAAVFCYAVFLATQYRSGRRLPALVPGSTCSTSCRSGSLTAAGRSAP